jgi:uncharacterized SAM-binding protein YcdF (DUF218 family)
VLVLFSMPVVADRLWRALQVPPDPVRAEARYDAVVLLGGVVSHGATAVFGQRSYNDNVERLFATFELLRARPELVAILSGGRGWSGDPVVEARVLHDQLKEWGLDEKRLIVEENAKNTRQNATFVAEVARARGFRRLLVITSAFHVPRARACFREVGLDVDLHPVDYRSYRGVGLGAWIPRAEILAASEDALREAAGRLVYWIVGYG